MKLNEYQVMAYGLPYPERPITEVAESIESQVNVTDLGEMLLYVTKLASEIGYTLKEVAESTVGEGGICTE